MMRRFFLKRYYRRRFQRAANILSWQYRRHKDAGHEVYLNAESPTQISFYCVNCPEEQPLRRKPEDVIHIYRTHDGKRYDG